MEGEARQDHQILDQTLDNLLRRPEVLLRRPWHSGTKTKKMKMTVGKTTHELEASAPEPKRLKQDDETNRERRVEITQVGEDSYYHMDDIIGEKEMAVWRYEKRRERLLSRSLRLFSDAPVDRVPPDPPKYLDDLNLADELEEKRLEKLGMLAPIEKRLQGYKNLTTRFVRDWRAKPRSKRA